ncbi:uncharacterized protein LOC141908999 isoform X2 [Tubulanus polymorphus]|uniref:uncharacterized protein LOC141908999 isoform X2 n=1 Tax=Tubulanus polymorphus TaxID=672921 RepID=UPI003DA64319
MTLALRYFKPNALKIHFCSVRYSATQSKCRHRDDAAQTNIQNIHGSEELISAVRKTERQKLFDGNQPMLQSVAALQLLDWSSSLPTVADDNPDRIPVLPSLLDQNVLESIIKPYNYTNDDISVGFIRRDDFASGGDNICDHSSSNASFGGDDFGSVGNVSTSVRERFPVTVIRHDVGSMTTTTFFSSAPDDYRRRNVWYATESRWPSSKSAEKDAPNQDQLNLVKDNMIYQIPKLLKTTHDYRIYTLDVVFENNYFGKNDIFKGINAYVWQLNKMKLMIHLNYAQAGVQVIGASTHIEDGTVRISWRIHGLPQLEAFKFWKFMPGVYKKTIKNESVSYPTKTSPR